MGILNGQLTARRFRVDGDLPEGFRDTYRDRLNEFSFQEPTLQGKEEVNGWVHIDEMMNTNFDNFNRWLIGEYLVISLRIDVIRLPAKRFKAELRRRVAEWCKEREIERCPTGVRTELKEILETDWIRRTMPTSRVVGFCWNLTSNVLYIESHSDPVCDRIRKRFFRTFGRRVVPFSPLDWIEKDDSLLEAMLAVPPSHLGGESGSNTYDDDQVSGDGAASDLDHDNTEPDLDEGEE